MTSSLVKDADLREAVAAERRELAEVLAGLPPESWDLPTLCAGWRVREVVAHMTMPFRYPATRFVLELIRSGGSFHRMADRCARRDAAGSAAELTAAVGDNAENPWQPPGGGIESALVHDVIHGLDITVALGIGRKVPADRLQIVLEVITRRKTVKYFGADLTGIQLRTDDREWSFGAGAVVSGAAQDLALVVCGRSLPAGLLRGEQVTRFTQA